MTSHDWIWNIHRAIEFIGTLIFHMGIPLVVEKPRPFTRALQTACIALQVDLQVTRGFNNGLTGMIWGIPDFKTHMYFKIMAIIVICV